jgi:uncharacterized Ntn-hydrolase superfamily protein
VARGQQSTFSIVASDPATGEVGVAVQSKYFSVGAVVPWAKAGVGAVATQAAGIAGYGPRVLALLEEGLAPAESLERALADDPGRETRQLGVVNAAGVAASFTGTDCNDWAGHETGPGYAVQGNILAGEDVVGEMARAFRETEGELAERLVAALEAGQAAGGDRRGQQSAAVIVERAGAGAGRRLGLDRICDLRVEDHERPIEELRRLLSIRRRWDVLRRAFDHHAVQEYAEGAAVLAAGIERFPDDPVLLYDLACYESMAGRGENAVAHLRQAVELDGSLKDLARGDSDFASLRDDAEFQSLF